MNFFDTMTINMGDYFVYWGWANIHGSESHWVIQGRVINLWSVWQEKPVARWPFGCLHILLIIWSSNNNKQIQSKHYFCYYSWQSCLPRVV